MWLREAQEAQQRALPLSKLGLSPEPCCEFVCEDCYVSCCKLVLFVKLSFEWRRVSSVRMQRLRGRLYTRSRTLRGLRKQAARSFPFPRVRFSFVSLALSWRALPRLASPRRELAWQALFAEFSSELLWLDAWR